MVISARSRRSSRLPKRDRLGGLGLGQRRVGEIVGDAVLVDGDQRDRFRRRRIAEARDDLRARQAVAAGAAHLLGLDQFALARAGAVAGLDPPVAVGPLVDGGDAAAGFALVVDADHPRRPHADAADHPGGERRVGTVEPRSCRPSSRSPAPSAGSSRRVRIWMRGAAPRASHSAGSAQRSPSASDAGDAQHQHRRQVAGGADAAAAFLERPVAGHLGEHPLQLDLGRALEARRRGRCRAWPSGSGCRAGRRGVRRGWEAGSCGVVTTPRRASHGKMRTGSRRIATRDWGGGGRPARRVKI